MGKSKNRSIFLLTWFVCFLLLLLCVFSFPSFDLVMRKNGLEIDSVKYTLKRSKFCIQTRNEHVLLGKSVGGAFESVQKVIPTKLKTIFERIFFSLIIRNGHGSYTNRERAAKKNLIFFSNKFEQFEFVVVIQRLTGFRPIRSMPDRPLPIDRPTKCELK